MGQDLSKELELANPVGTKIMISVTIEQNDGYSKLMATMFAKDKEAMFKELTGCSINKIFLKDAKLDATSLTTEELLNICLDKVRRGE